MNTIPYLPVADPALLPDDVFIYRNLHKTGADGEPVYSIRNTATRLVVAHTSHITLTNVTFVVSAAGQERVRREHRKNVHAGLRGQPHTTPAETQPGDAALRRAYYNPYRVDTFIDADTGIPLHHTQIATIDADGVHYQPHQATSPQPG